MSTTTPNTDTDEMSLTRRSLQLLKRLYPYMTEAKGHLHLLLVSLVVSSLITLPSPFLYKSIIDHVLPSQEMSLLWIITIVLVVSEIFLQIFSVFSSWTLSLISQKTVTLLRKSMFKRLLNVPFQRYLETPPGSMVNRLVAETEAVAEFIAKSLWAIPFPIVTFMLGGTVMLFWYWPLGIYLMVSIPMTIFLTKRLAKRLRRIRKRQRDQQEEFQGSITESIDNIRIIRAFAQEEAFDKQLNKEVVEYSQHTMDAQFNASCLRSANRVIEVASHYIFIIVGAYLVIDKRITLGEFFAFKFFQDILSTSVNTLFNYITELPTHVISIGRALEVMELDVEENLDTGETCAIDDSPIEFRNVGLTYPDDTIALKDINFTVKSRETIALIGPSGSGKSSLTSLLLGLYPVSSGDIYFGDTPISRINKQHLRRQIGMIYQDAELFNRSIRENLLLANANATEEAMWHALEIANASGFVKDTPDTLDAIIGNKGIKLSGGQRQRLTIARALLKNPSLLIMDEATSALDSISEKSIQNALKEISKKRTTIIVAHRLSTIVHANRIIVMQDGGIAEMGDHKTLLAKKGLYFDLFSSQMDGFLSWENTQHENKT